jgi:hypothetical protein
MKQSRRSSGRCSSQAKDGMSRRWSRRKWDLPSSGHTMLAGNRMPPGLTLIADTPTGDWISVVARARAVHGRLGEPALIDADGCLEWWTHGVHGRVNGPATVYPDGRVEWRRDGTLHRDGGPAVYSADEGEQEWWRAGALHRLDGRRAPLQPAARSTSSRVVSKVRHQHPMWGSPRRPARAGRPRWLRALRSARRMRRRSARRRRRGCSRGRRCGAAARSARPPGRRRS